MSMFCHWIQCAMPIGSAKRHNLPLSALAQFVDGVDQGDGIFHWCLRQHAVAEVEDVAGPAGGLIEYFLCPAANLGGGAQQDRRDRDCLGWPCRSRSFARRRPDGFANLRRSVTFFLLLAVAARHGNKAGLPVAKLITGTSGGRDAITAWVCGNT